MMLRNISATNETATRRKICAKKDCRFRQPFFARIYLIKCVSAAEDISAHEYCVIYSP